MKFNTQWVDVRPYLAAAQQPVFLLERPLLHGQSPKGGVFGIAEVARQGTYWVPEDDPITGGGKWAVTRSGTHVRVPILAYRTEVRGLAAIWALGLQLGLATLVSIRQHVHTTPTELHLILGHECTDLAPQFSSFRCYVGLAIRTDAE